MEEPPRKKGKEKTCMPHVQDHGQATFLGQWENQNMRQKASSHKDFLATHIKAHESNFQGRRRVIRWANHPTLPLNHYTHKGDSNLIGLAHLLGQ